MTNTDKSVPQLSGMKWVMALSFIVDKMTCHNKKFQGHSKLLWHMLSDVNNCQVKLGLLHTDISNKLLPCSAIQNCFPIFHLTRWLADINWQLLLYHSRTPNWISFTLWHFNDFKQFLPLNFICMHKNTVHLALNNVMLQFHLPWCNLYK